MFIHSFDPTLFAIGPLEVRWYGLVYALGFLFAYWYLARAARTGVLKVTKKETEDFVLALIILSLVCARIAYVTIYNPAHYLENPLEVLFVWEGGLSFHGGLIGAVLAALWFRKKSGVPFYTMADLLVTPFALVLVFGRLANFINGELPGKPSSAPWCVVFPGYEECRHPSQLYEALKNLIVFATLTTMNTWGAIKEQLAPGVLFWTFVFLYGMGRFITDFWRAPDPTDPVFFGLLLGQWLSLLMAIIAAGFVASRAHTRT